MALSLASVQPECVLAVQRAKVQMPHLQPTRVMTVRPASNHVFLRSIA